MQEAEIPNQTPPATPVAGPAPLPASDAIIRAEKVEKYYAQPSQNRIQVISATDLSILPGEILALAGSLGLGQIDHAEHVERALHAHGRARSTGTRNRLPARRPMSPSSSRASRFFPGSRCLRMLKLRCRPAAWIRTSAARAA